MPRHPRRLVAHVSPLFLAAAVGVAGGCSDKPKSSAPPPVAPQTSPNNGPVGSMESAGPTTRTIGGVELGIVAEPVRVAAMRLAKDRKAGVAALVAQGPVAHDAVLALLGSASLEEVVGALEVVAADGDPTKTRHDAAAKVTALLSHDAEGVRAAATRVAELLDDPQAFIALVKSDKLEARVTGVRLLGGWGGAEVEALLVPLIADESLGLEAALAMSTPGKVGAVSQRVLDAATVAIAPEATPTTLRAGLTLLRRLAKPVPPEAAERALKSTDIDLAIEGVRASPSSVLLSLGADPRAEVRRALAEEAWRIETSDARTALVNALAKDADDRVRAASAMALVKTGGGTAAPMDALLTDSVDAVRKAAIAATTTLPEAEASTRLATRLQSANDDDKVFITWALERVPGRAAVDVLIGALADKSYGPVAHIVLQRRSGKDFPPEVEKWRAWADAEYPAPKVEEPPKDAPKPDAPKETPKDAPKPK